MIELKSLSKTYRTEKGGVRALSGINLSIRKGEIFGIIGVSGAGKSTLVRCINMLEKPTSGTVLFDGKDLSRFSAAQLRAARRSMGMIFQQFNLLMQRTAEGNVCFPLEIAGVKRAKARERAKELLALVGLADKGKAYPSQLSGGQKQRVAIARALATNPKVLLCDEATSALDPATTKSILSLLRDINRRLGITIVIITHQMSVIEAICSRVAILSESRVAECGSVEEVFFHPKTEAARRLVYPEGRVDRFVSKRRMRIVFDGNSSFEPVISNMVLACGKPVNILYADTKNIGGRAFGQMIVQLPEEQDIARKMLDYVRSRGLSAEEVGENVG